MSRARHRAPGVGRHGFARRHSGDQADAGRRPATTRQRRLGWLCLGLALGTLAIVARLVLIEDRAVPESGARAALAPVEPAPATAVGPLDPTRFQQDGCVAFAPTAGDRASTVALDAGHGGLDPGAPGQTSELQEKDLTLAITQEAARELRARGFRVVLSRVGDGLGSRITSRDVAAGSLTEEGQRSQLAARARCANLAGADALVSIHLNSFEQPDVRGAETLFEPDRAFGDRNRLLASLLQREILRGFAGLGRPVPDRGIRSDTASEGSGPDSQDLILLGPKLPGRIDEPSAMPGALVEPLFLTNPDDAALATTTEGRKALATALGTALEDFLERS